MYYSSVNKIFCMGAKRGVRANPSNSPPPPPPICLRASLGTRPSKNRKGGSGTSAGVEVYTAPGMKAHFRLAFDRGVRHGASRRTRFRNPLDFKWISDFRMDFGFQNGFLDFKVDFWISKWISGFQSGFLDFKVDFWISKRISGFQSGFLEGFLDFKRISGFQSGFLDFKVDFSRDFWVSSEFLDFKADFWISFEPLLIRYS